MRRRAFLASVGGTAVTVSIAGCSSSGDSGTSENEYDIGMSTSAFRPAEFAVAPGTRLAVFIFAGILISLIGVRFAAYVSGGSVEDELVEQQ